MKLAAACWLLLLTMAQGQTVRLSWKPEYFNTLTERPWKFYEPHEVSKIVELIFREPNPDIRYPVLAACLRQVPMLHFAYAFDVALLLEGTQKPNELVALMLPIWAERDPQEAWERTQSLARLVAFEEGLLGYDSWLGRPKIEVQDLAALRASRYWIQSRALLTFPAGVRASHASEEEKARVLKAFDDMWLRRFKSQPGKARVGYTGRNEELMKMFDLPWDYLRKGDVTQTDQMGVAAFEMGLRRWVNSAYREKDGAEIVQRIHRKRWKTDHPGRLDGYEDDHFNDPIFTDFLLMWSQTSSGSVWVWQRTAEHDEPEVVQIARCVLSIQTEVESWTEGLPPKELGNYLYKLASWVPETAMKRAVQTNDAEIVESVGAAAVQGVWNWCHAGLGFINAFDLQKLPEPLREEVRKEWGITLMEKWVYVDVGEAARYGFRFLLQDTRYPKENLMRLFSGDDRYAEDSSMVDRTFCALRTWAVFKPDEMREWIGKQEGADMRKALTWLLENPWGHDAEEAKDGEKAKE